MTNSDTIVEAEFVQYVINGEMDKIKEAYFSFSAHLINFIHKPVHWVEKHHCLVQLNAIFHLHTLQTKCEVINKYISLALSLIETMKELLMAAQKKCADALNSLRAGVTLPDGTEIKWTGGKGNLYECKYSLKSGPVAH